MLSERLTRNLPLEWSLVNITITFSTGIQASLLHLWCGHLHHKEILHHIGISMCMLLAILVILTRTTSLPSTTRLAQVRTWVQISLPVELTIKKWTSNHPLRSIITIKSLRRKDKDMKTRYKACSTINNAKERGTVCAHHRLTSWTVQQTLQTARKT